jgi:hypothetical protein
VTSSRPPGRSQSAIREQAWLFVERYVDERVEADDGVKGTVREGDLVGVGVHEYGVGNELPGAGDLDLAEVDSGDVVTATGKRRGDRDLAAASQVRDAGADRDLVLQGRQPGPVLDWVVGVGGRGGTRRRSRVEPCRLDPMGSWRTSWAI